MDKEVIKNIIAEKQAEIQNYNGINRNITLDDKANYILIGLRRAGKSYTLYQDINKHIAAGKADIRDILFMNFEDERLVGLEAGELGILLEGYGELFPLRRPLVYLDEIQNITGWEKFARRLADTKYRVRITGSNAKMLSREMATTLGGRYIPKEIYPFSFKEYLAWHDVRLTDNWEYSAQIRATAAHLFEDYFHIGGISEVYELADKREALSSLYQKILMGDIVERNHIRNPRVFRLLARKLAESVMQPTTQSRLQHIIRSTGEGISLPVLKDYLQYMEDAFLIFGIPNITSAFSEQETIKKRYFADNGILNLFMTNGETRLLENIVAITLNQKYHSDEEPRLFYYNRGMEIDFCIPEAKTAIQVSYSLADTQTFERETKALSAFLNEHSQYTGLIITHHEEHNILLGNKQVSVVPIWKWLLMQTR